MLEQARENQGNAEACEEARRRIESAVYFDRTLYTIEEFLRLVWMEAENIQRQDRPKHPEAPVKVFYTLVYLRKQAGHTQESLAKAMGVSLGSVAAWELGTRRPSPESLQKMASFFDVSLDYLKQDAPTVEIAKQVLAEQVMRVHQKPLDKVTEADKRFLLSVIRTLTPHLTTEEKITQTPTEDSDRVKQRAIRRLAQYGYELKEEN